MSTEDKAPIDRLASLLLRRQVWGPFLIFVGAYSLFGLGLGSSGSGTSPLEYTRVVVGSILVLAGIAMMFVQLRSDFDTIRGTATTEPSPQPEYTVSQLSLNYELLRRQTTQGFVLSGVFMALGLLVILSGSAGALFGFTKTGTDLTSVAGIIMEFISATALLIYRLNFSRLNDTTDKLDSAWRVLTAHRLSADLPDDQRPGATLRLIDALLREPVTSARSDSSSQGRVTGPHNTAAPADQKAPLPGR